MAPQIELPRVTQPADEAEVMHEQLDYLIEHAAEAGQCGCSECQRYARVRAALLSIFDEREKTNLVVMPVLARTA